MRRSFRRSCGGETKTSIARVFRDPLVRLRPRAETAVHRLSKARSAIAMLQAVIARAFERSTAGLEAAVAWGVSGLELQATDRRISW